MSITGGAVSSFARPFVLAASLLLLAAGCGSDDPGPAPEATDRAVERLVDYGLTEAQASCVVDDLGAPVVAEAGDINALVESQPYRDAVEGCVDDG